MASSNKNFEENSQKNGPQGSLTEFGRPNNLQKIAQKKSLVRSYSRLKKLEKLAVYSSCKVCELFNFKLKFINYLIILGLGDIEHIPQVKGHQNQK